jgi:hypothetical protein
LANIGVILGQDKNIGPILNQHWPNIVATIGRAHRRVSKLPKSAVYRASDNCDIGITALSE